MLLYAYVGNFFLKRMYVDIDRDYIKEKTYIHIYIYTYILYTYNYI